jgi:hypothetical protein
MEYTILDDGRTIPVSADAVTTLEPGRLLIEAAALEASLGWELKPEGLCQGDVCVPVRDRAALVHEDRIDLGALGETLGRPVVIDSEERVAALGTAASSQAASMASLDAPDFELPDLAGRLHTLSEHRGKKALLIAYASW